MDENGQVAVPNLLSQTEENAVELLEQLGLKGNKTGESSSSEYGAGVVMSQEIAEGTKVDQGTVINYTVSTGSDAPVVPEVNGMTQSQAEAAIKALGLETSIQQQYSDTVGIGKVISADPGAGTTLAAGQTVTLVVSLGEENKQVAVPNVFNMDENTAKQTLQDNSFKVNVETTEESSGANEGWCSQPERSWWEQRWIREQISPFIFIMRRQSHLRRKRRLRSQRRRQPHRKLEAGSVM